MRFYYCDAKIILNKNSESSSSHQQQCIYLWYGHIYTFRIFAVSFIFFFLSLSFIWFDFIFCVLSFQMGALAAQSESIDLYGFDHFKCAKWINWRIYRKKRTEFLGSCENSFFFLLLLLLLLCHRFDILSFRSSSQRTPIHFT